MYFTTWQGVSLFHWTISSLILTGFSSCNDSLHIHQLWHCKGSNCSYLYRFITYFTTCHANYRYSPSTDVYIVKVLQLQIYSGRKIQMTLKITCQITFIQSHTLGIYSAKYKTIPLEYNSIKILYLLMSMTIKDNFIMNKRGGQLNANCEEQQCWSIYINKKKLYCKPFSVTLVSH